MLLDGKRLLVTGVLAESSIAYAAARLAREQGAELLLTGFGRGLRITRQVAAKLDPDCPVLEMDVTDPATVAAVVQAVERRWGRLDGVLHAIAFAPKPALDGGFLTAAWPEVATTLQVSTYSFVEVGRAFGPLLAAAGGGSLVGLDFDATRAWPGYDWMGVAKAGLESCCRYLAHALGPAGTRVNLVAAGPLRTVAATAIHGFAGFERAWQDRAPLGWDVRDATAVGRAICALWSDWLPSVTGSVIHVDGGAHALAAGAGPGAVTVPAGATAGRGAPVPGTGPAVVAGSVQLAGQP